MTAAPAAALTVDVVPDTGPLAAVLRCVAKHALACANELDALAGRKPNQPAEPGPDTPAARTATAWGGTR